MYVVSGLLFCFLFFFFFFNNTHLITGEVGDSASGCDNPRASGQRHICLGIAGTRIEYTLYQLANIVKGAVTEEQK